MKVLLDAATVTGAGTEVLTHRLERKPTYHTFMVTFTGDPTAVTVGYEASLDGGNTWFEVGTHTADAGELTADGYIDTLVDIPVDQIRVNLNTLTDGTTPTVSVHYTYS